MISFFFTENPYFCIRAGGCNMHLIYLWCSLNNNVWVCTWKYFFPKSMGSKYYVQPPGKFLGVIWPPDTTVPAPLILFNLWKSLFAWRHWHFLQSWEEYCTSGAAICFQIEVSPLRFLLMLLHWIERKSVTLSQLTYRRSLVTPSGVDP